MSLDQLEVREINSMVVKPCGDHILISVEKEPDATLVGMVIALADQGPNKKTVIGRVTAVGPGISTKDLERPITIEIGQRVIVANHVGWPVNMGDRGLHVLVKNNDVLAVIESEDSREVV